ncbi:MAG: ATP-binding cassette domain-containing protein, partial [Bacteroidota bacterium]
IRFEDIHFSYPNHPVLHGVSFSVKKGQTVALVGPSGAGKSTLVDLIPRFYDPAGGSILIDGKDIRQVKIADLRALIGNVTQEGILFHDTVFANIAYGQPETALEKVMEAAKMAHAHEFIQELPEGYQTVIGERGTALSGGQRQRLSIARAILRDPDVLILDEATSNLDTASERLVQDALTALMEDRTSIVIAHRLSTILQADEILVLEAGKIIERGRHQDLLLQNGLYRTLFDMQFQS